MNTLPFLKTLQGVTLVSVSAIYIILWIYLLYCHFIKGGASRDLKKIIVAVFSFFLITAEHILIYCYPFSEGVLIAPLSELLIKLFILTTVFIVQLFQSSGFILGGMGVLVKYISFVCFSIILIDLFAIMLPVRQCHYIMMLSGLMVTAIILLFAKFSSICIKRYDFIKESVKKENLGYAFISTGVGLIASYVAFISALSEGNYVISLVSLLFLVAVHLFFIYRRYLVKGSPRRYAQRLEDEASDELPALFDEASTSYHLIINRLILLFENEKPYLDSDLKLADVSKRIYTNKTYVSRALNHGMSKNFSQFVNYYRVREACGIFMDDPDLSLADLCDRSGFKSLSSFSTAFNIHTGYTPAEWCREIKKKINNNEHVEVEDYFS